MNNKKSLLLALATTMLAPLAGPAQATVIINEVLRNPDAVSDTDGEWFELFNTGPTAIDLFDWTIKDADTDSHTVGLHVTIDPAQYLVLGRNGDTSANGGVNLDYVYSGITLANGTDELILLDAAGTEIDAIVFDATWPDSAGVAMGLNDPSLDNADPANWSAMTVAFGAGDAGTPGLANLPAAAPITRVDSPATLALFGLGAVAWLARPGRARHRP